MASSSSPPAGSSVYYDNQEREGGDSYTIRQEGGHSVKILLDGAQIISWKTRGNENLFLSHRASTEPRPRLRGGIRICFPKMFNSPRVARKHGFARRSLWKMVDFGRYASPDMPPVAEHDSYADFVLELKDIEYFEYILFPNRFEFRLRVILSTDGKLSMISRIQNQNTDGSSFTFPFSYQNYLYVFSAGSMEILGLEGREYRDYKGNRELSRQGADAFTFDSPVAVDRLYLQTPNQIILRDSWLSRTITIEKSSNLPDTVVWNPMVDVNSSRVRLENLDTRMVVIEAAAQQEEITLSPGQVWVATQSLSSIISSW